MKLTTGLIYSGLALSLLFSGCSNDDKYNVNNDDDKEFFDFATSAKCRLDITYDVPEGYRVFFEMYAENPFTTDNNGQQIKRADIKPIAKGFTDENGKFNHEVIIPAYVGDVYVYSPYVGVPALLSGKVMDKKITVFSQDYTTALYTRANGDHQSVHNGFKTIGSWKSGGTPDYLINSINISGSLLDAINNAFNEGRPVNKAYFKKTDIVIKENANVTLTFISENTANNNVLGYYCYDTDNKPATAEEIQDKIVAFPRAKTGILKRGNTIQLKYWKDGVNKGDVFPAGTSIGWVLCSDGYNFNSVQGISKGREYFYSNPNFNPETSGEKNHVALFQKDKFICFGFEDWYNNLGDGDCNDVIFHVASNPVGAIEEVPEVPENPKDPEKVAYTMEYAGTLAFEDIWPYQGDYDMNDVVVKYNSTVSFNHLNEVISTQDTFQLLWAGAQYENSFGYQLSTDRSNASVEIKSEGYTSPLSGIDEQLSKATVMLFDNAVTATADNTRQPKFIVTTKYRNRISIDDFVPAPYNPFIVVKNNYNRTEIHLSNYKPTEKADQSLFGTGNDLSDPVKGIYYVSDNHFPFAINIIGNDEYRIPDEMIRIDKIYPKFNDWATSKGETNKDWYKYPEK